MSPPKPSGSPTKASPSGSAATKSGSQKADKASVVRAADAKAGATPPSKLATAKVPAAKAPPSKSLAAKKSPATGSPSPGKNLSTPTAKKAGTGAKTAKNKGNVTKAEAPVLAAPQLGEEEQARMKAEEERKQAEALAKADAEMEQLRKKAWVAQVELERKEEAKRRRKAEDEARRKKEEAKLIKDMLEAAFDGEDAELQTLLERAKSLGMKKYVEAADAHGNTILSEAAAGGTLSTVQLLLNRGADPNTRGEFARTPLWRACFLGKAEVVMPLLGAGGDPRIGNEQGELPLHVAAGAAIKEALQGWDEAETDRILASWQDRTEEAAAAEEAERKAAVQTAEGEVAASKTDFDNAQAALKHARCELEKRIFEHDTCVEENKPDDLIKMTLDQIKSSEVTVESAKARATEASRRLDAARLALRESVAAAAHGDADDEAPIPGVAVEIKELDDVLVRDVGDKIKADGRWPLVIDPSGQASVFLRYLDTNYVNLLSSHNIDPNRLRRSILGGIRYGKPVILDMMDIDLWDEVPRVFDAVQPGLLQSLLNKSLLKNELYTSLIKPEDGEEYERSRYQDDRVAAFKIVLLTASAQPNPAMLDATYVLRVLVKG